MAGILHYYAFQISQLSPMGMVRIRHFEFLCRSQGLEPTVEKFRVFYQLIRTLGFFSFALRNVKKILINPPKSFHNWKMKFFFIREEVIPIAMLFHEPGAIDKEDTPIPKKAAGNDNLCATPNRVVGEQVFVAAVMSDKWSEQSREVPVLLLHGEGVLRDLGIDHEEKRPKKTAAKKKVTITGGANKKVGATHAASDAASKNGTLHFRQSNLEDFVVATDTLGLHNIGDKPQSSAVAVARSTGSARLKGPDFGATPSFIHEEAEIEKPEAEKLIRKRSRAETATTTSLAKKIATGKPIEKKGSLRSPYTDVSPEVVANKPEVEVKKMPSHPKFNIIPPKQLLLRERPVGWRSQLKNQLRREWYLGAFPPAEVDRQKERGNDNLDRSYVMGQANANSAGHQILHEWRTMHLERAGWEKYQERLSPEAKLFEQAQVKLQEEKAVFDKDKSEEWGLQGLKIKLQASKDTLAKECREWLAACQNENKKMFAARTKITNLEAEVRGLNKSEADFKEKYEEARSHRERVEVELNAQIDLEA
ncbi:hypothetical protein HanPSC8_Chr06g0242511 [Helianthus annuus]|nr:hypothetical protein HanPSC8_Chr06g0242511 [Helianthus annuus]